MSQYKLYYFNSRGKAEVARLLFALGGQSFEDFRFERDQWPTHKPNMPYGQVPVLEITEGDKKIMLPQSMAIYRYLANKYGHAGKTDLEKAQVDAIADLINDMINAAMPGFYEQDPVKKEEFFTKYFAETIHSFLAHLVKALEENKGGFLVGDVVTFADLILVNSWEWMKAKDTIFEKYPALKAHYEKVRLIPQIAEWIQKRPVTEY